MSLKQKLQVIQGHGKWHGRLPWKSSPVTLSLSSMGYSPKRGQSRSLKMVPSCRVGVNFYIPPSIWFPRWGWPPGFSVFIFGVGKLESLDYSLALVSCRSVYPFWLGSQVWQTDRQTDVLTIAKAALRITSCGKYSVTQRPCEWRYKLSYVDFGRRYDRSIALDTNTIIIISQVLQSL